MKPAKTPCCLFSNERLFPKLNVAGSIPVSRSIKSIPWKSPLKAPLSSLLLTSLVAWLRLKIPTHIEKYVVYKVPVHLDDARCELE
jgi:hypothetical protein